MELIKISYDPFLKKEVEKIRFNNPPKLKIFNSADILEGNPLSNLAIAFIYTWKKDKPPKKIKELFNKISNYAAITGYWRTTNGSKYVFTNLLNNPNINKLLILVFDAKDNGHLLVNALKNFWKNGVNKEGIIKETKAANPRFEGITSKTLKRIKEQSDLVIYKNIKESDKVEELVKALIQEPENAKNTSDFDIEFYSKKIKNGKLYDDGCRFKRPYKENLDLIIREIKEHKEIKNQKVLGASINAKDLREAYQNLTSFIAKYGTIVSDQRGIKTKECRSLTITIKNVLKEIPPGFSKHYLKRYAQEFIKGISSEDFSYTYYSRIFKKWGNQPEKIIKILKENNNSRRAIISLWDQNIDLGNVNPPCLNIVWLAIRNKKLELHALYRSHHIATINEHKKVMIGEGAFVPNLYALAKLQEGLAKKLKIGIGKIVITEFSSHLYISKIN